METTFTLKCRQKCNLMLKLNHQNRKWNLMSEIGWSIYWKLKNTSLATYTAVSKTIIPTWGNQSWIGELLRRQNNCVLKCDLYNRRLWSMSAKARQSSQEGIRKAQSRALYQYVVACSLVIKNAILHETKTMEAEDIKTMRKSDWNQRRNYFWKETGDWNTIDQL